jgi:hypothetical protein
MKSTASGDLTPYNFKILYIKVSEKNDIPASGIEK